MTAARMRGEPLDHVVIYGPPGLGKTTLANIIAQEMGATIKVTSGPAVERASDLASILTGLQPNDVLFIDEIHRLNRAVEEVMYSAMEDFFLSWVVGKGLSARSINLRINPFTLVGATTRYSLISAPLRDRFGSVFRLDYYSDEDMETVVGRSARILGIAADDDGLRQVSARSRGTPRIANRLLRRARDYALVRADNRVTGPVAQEALDRLGVDARGLDETDHRLLSNIIHKFDGGPVGLDTLAASLSEDASTVMEVLEPFLLQPGIFGTHPPRPRRHPAGLRIPGLAPGPARTPAAPGKPISLASDIIYSHAVRKNPYQIDIKSLTPAYRLNPYCRLLIIAPILPCRHSGNRCRDYCHRLRPAVRVAVFAISGRFGRRQRRPVRR